MDTNSPSEPTAAPRRLLAGWRLYAILAVLILLVGAGIFSLRGMHVATTNSSANENATNSGTSSRGTFRRFPTVQTNDQDADGLSDEEEAALHTNPKLADTDGDELTDAQEANAYHTNPLKQDTDGDGFPDGQEVKSGNNPNGKGPLLDTAGAINQLSNR